MFDYFKREAEEAETPPEKRRVKFEYSGLSGGERSLEWFRAWEFHQHNTPAVFGEPWINLPVWLQRDLIVLMQMKRWHEINAKRKTPTGQDVANNPLTK